MPTAQEILTELEVLSGSAPSVEDLMSTIVERLHRDRPLYDWVGFYMIEKGLPGAEPMLVVGPFIGADTHHKRIPLNSGICGAAASAGETIVVDDVNSDPRYLACSIETKSEIVVPIYLRGAVVGELDIDSHSPAAFGPEDRELCERVAQLVSRYLERNS